MAISLIELRQDLGGHSNDGLIYVLRVSDFTQNIQRTPTVLEIPGDSETGEPNLIGFDLGVTKETITLNGDIRPTDNTLLVSTDENYEAGLDKYYPGKLELREAVLTWWADANWADRTGMVHIFTPLRKLGDYEEYGGTIENCQFSLPPATDMYSFTLTFRVLSYFGAAAMNRQSNPT